MVKESKGGKPEWTLQLRVLFGKEKSLWTRKGGVTGTGGSRPNARGQGGEKGGPKKKEKKNETKALKKQTTQKKEPA